MGADDRIETDTRALCLPEGRRVGRPGHDVARQYLLGRLRELGLSPFRHEELELPYTRPSPVNGEPTAFTNLVGVIPGRDRDAPPLLIGAHYDSVIDAPCADDNATAVAVALAAAERLSGTGLARDVIIALFDAEEPPYFHSEAMGSTRFYEDHCADVEFGCVLVMDLIGHDVELGMSQVDSALPHLRDLLFVLGAESHSGLPPVVERAASAVDGLRVFPTLNSYIGDMSDHHAFRLGGQPFLFLSCAQGRYYHDPRDTAEWVNFDKVRRVRDLVERLVREMDAAPLDGGAAPDDPVEFEVRMITDAIGPALPLILGFIGIGQLETRADIDKIANALAGSFPGL
ncbi:MAG: M28 family metallopeptidase [Planctomycetota bacterium]|jgi:hypothetical protein